MNWNLKVIVFCFLSFSVIPIGTLNAQDVANRPLTIGDQVPDFVFPAVNHTSDSFRISDAKGKLLLLEFWARSCGTCIMQFPKLSRLQKHFGNELIVMPLGITTRTSNSGDFFMDNMVNEPLVELPTAIVNRPDSVFESCFEYTGLPHVIWIGKNQRILAITNHMAVNQTNIEKALSGATLELSLKPTKRFQARDEVFLISDTSLMEGSIVHPYIDSLYGTGGIPAVFISGERRVCRVINMPVASLFTAIYRSVRDLSTDSVPSNLYSPKFREIGLDFPYLDAHDISPDWDNHQIDEFNLRNLFCYEFVAPRDLPLSEFYRRIIADIENKFQVKSSLKSKVMLHGVVTLTPKFYDWRPLEESDDGQVSYFERLGMVSYLSEIANRLDKSVNFTEPISFFGPDIKFDHPIRLEIDDSRSREQILADLRKRGVELVHCEKVVDVLVLE